MDRREETRRQAIRWRKKTKSRGGAENSTPQKSSLKFEKYGVFHLSI